MLYGRSAVTGTGMSCRRANSMSAVRELRSHSRQGAITRRSGRQRGVRQLEAHLVVALAGGAVGDRVGAFRARDLHLGLGDERPRDRGAEQVGALVDARSPAASGR